MHLARIGAGGKAVKAVWLVNSNRRHIPSTLVAREWLKPQGNAGQRITNHGGGGQTTSFTVDMARYRGQYL